MFTGIVERTGRVLDCARHEGGMRLRLDTDLGLEVGESAAVNGVCLTAVEVGEAVIGFDVVPETLARTNLGDLGSGDPVNLERSMAAADRFDGHIVQGHVDGVGVVTAVEPEGGGRRLGVSIPEGLAKYLVEKGSVTVDGVSLTVAAVGAGVFQVALIPHTLEVTVLGRRAVGDRVNLEVDVLAKYVERLLEARA